MGVDRAKTEGQRYSNENSSHTYIVVRLGARDVGPSDSVSPSDRTYPQCWGRV